MSETMTTPSSAVTVSDERLRELRFSGHKARSVEVRLIAAELQRFRAPATEWQGMRETLETIRELNRTNADENGHRWSCSDLIDQEIIAALGKLPAPKGADE